MTSYLIGILLQDGKLSLETKVKSIFPDITFEGQNANITILDLLTHRSGFVEPTEFNSFWKDSFTSSLATRKQRTRFIEILFKSKAQFASGEKNEYSNSGYIVLGAIIEKIYDQSWETKCGLKVDCQRERERELRWLHPNSRSTELCPEQLFWARHIEKCKSVE